MPIKNYLSLHIVDKCLIALKFCKYNILSALCSHHSFISQNLSDYSALIIHIFFIFAVSRFIIVDLYQITMAYAYWKSGKVDDNAVFDLYFRKNPFDGEFTIFAGLDECLRFLENFRYSETDIEYLKQTLPDSIENDFFDYLKDLTAKDVTLYAVPEGSVVFPR